MNKLKNVFLVLSVIDAIIVSFYSIYLGFKYPYESDLSLWVNHFNEIIILIPFIVFLFIFYILYRYFENN